MRCFLDDPHGFPLPGKKSCQECGAQQDNVTAYDCPGHVNACLEYNKSDEGRNYEKADRNRCNNNHHEAGVQGHEPKQDPNQAIDGLETYRICLGSKSGDENSRKGNVCSSD